MRRAEAEEVEEAKKVEDDGLRKMHRERKALRASFYVGAEASDPLKSCSSS